MLISCFLKNLIPRAIYIQNVQLRTEFTITLILKSFNVSSLPTFVITYCCTINYPKVGGLKQQYIIISYGSVT